MRSPAALIVLLVLQCACARHQPFLYGSYKITGQAGRLTVAPSATLEIAHPNIYTFCEAGRCTRGKLELLPVPDPAHGRVTFMGAQMEAFVLALSLAAYGPGEPEWRRRPQGQLDYTSDLLGTEIPLGVGDLAFVKQ